jgi:hypothetical protein
MWICAATNSRDFKGLLFSVENAVILQNNFCGEIGQYEVRKIIKTYDIN